MNKVDRMENRENSLTEWLEELNRLSKDVRNSKDEKRRYIVEGRFGDRMVVDVPLGQLHGGSR